MTEPSLDLDEGSKFYYYKNLFTGKLGLFILEFNFIISRHG